MESRTRGCRRKRTAFTLIETLLVVAILIALTAVLYSAFGSVRARARETSCISNLRQIGQAMAMYRADMGGEEATVGKSSSCVDLGLPCNQSAVAFMDNYNITKAMYTCPDYKGQNPGNVHIWYIDDDGLPEPYRISYRTDKHGESAIIVADDCHNRLFDEAREPNWTRKRVLALRLNGQVDMIVVPYNSHVTEW